MIKIIKPGITTRVTSICSYCGCVYEYGPEDVIEDIGFTGGGRHIMCPCCGRRNTVYPFETYGDIDLSNPTCEVKNDKEV